MSTKAKQAEAAEAVERLREVLKPGDTVYCTIRHVSRSGMSRVIDLHTIEGGELRGIGRLAARAMGDSYNVERDGIRVSGCGMDMCSATVYNLGRVLFRDDKRVKRYLDKRYPHRAQYGPNDDPGYALENRTV